MTEFADAVATTTLPHPPERVWRALTDPAEITQYFFGTEVVTDWQVGESIVWRGEWQGKQYEDRGEVLAFEPAKRLRVSHYSPLTGLPDTPENYHTVTWALEPAPGGTELTIRQGNNKSEGEITESEKTWQSVLDGLEQYLAQAN
ncbi:SRPBCC domain-containing protein [Nocardia sp. JMUB6875]|uniref:SRPBCC family protein n=1 Tax=Nocardia sp. JMUB6875 TaxID=3158170 RepID=UPI0032E65DDE